MTYLNVPILAYHEITPETSSANYPWAIAVRQFKSEMQYLYDHGYLCVSLTELMQEPDSRRFHGRRAVAITFDDGFQDFFTLASPILCEYGFTATVFVITGKTQWQSNLEHEGDNEYLTWEHIEALQKSNFSFGSHTCTHPRLPSLSRENIQHELSSSKECLEARLGQPIQWLSYPYGSSTSEIQEMTEVAGYQAAFGGSLGRSSRFNIRRHFCLAGDTLLDFAFGLSYFSQYFETLRYDTKVAQFLRKVKHRIGF